MKKGFSLTLVLFLALACSSKSRSSQKSTKPAPDPVRKAIISNIHDFRECYRSELDGQIKTLEGRATFVFDLTPYGELLNEKVKSRTKKLTPSLERCLLDVLRSVKFPTKKSGKNITQPFDFFPKK
jgi:hypothetical protein